jgi:hypothetical protein
MTFSVGTAALPTAFAFDRFGRNVIRRAQIAVNDAVIVDVLQRVQNAGRDLNGATQSCQKSREFSIKVP